MSTKYINMLPDYLAGYLDETQSKKIEEELLRDSQLRAELDAIEKTLEDYAHATAQKAAPDVHAAIWEKINDENVVVLEGLTSMREETPTFQIGNLFNSYIGIAASVLLLASFLGNIYLAKQVEYQKNNFLSTLKEKNELQSSMREAQASTDLYAQEVALLKNPNMKVCKLVSAASDQPRSLLLAIDMTKEMQVSVMSPDLPAKPSDHSYQLWAISSTGEMVCMGTFDSEKKIYTMKKLPFDPKEFGVTMEEGELGKPQPTSEFLVRGI